MNIKLVVLRAEGIDGETLRRLLENIEVEPEQGGVMDQPEAPALAPVHAVTAPALNAPVPAEIPEVATAIAPMAMAATKPVNAEKSVKTCRKCGKTLPIGDFMAQNLSADGRSHVCRGCSAKKGRPKGPDVATKAAHAPQVIPAMPVIRDSGNAHQNSRPVDKDEMEKCFNEITVNIRQGREVTTEWIGDMVARYHLPLITVKQYVQDAVDTSRMRHAAQQAKRAAAPSAA